MNKLVLIVLVLSFTVVSHAQNRKLNQIVELNSGNFSDDNENVTVVLIDPIQKDTFFLDTIKADGGQYILVDGKYAYVLAVETINKYDIDKRTKVASGTFDGFSAHRIIKNDDFLYVTEFFSGSTTNLCVYGTDDLSLVKCIDEIQNNPKGLAVLGDSLYVSQNLDTSKDLCPPFGCYNDTAGYVAVIDLTTNKWVRDFSLSNNGADLGRMFVYDGKWFAMNPRSNTITSYDPILGLNQTDSVFSGAVNISDFGTNSEIQGNFVYGNFGQNLGRINLDNYEIENLIDQRFVAMALDSTKDEFYLTNTNYVDQHKGYHFDYDGNLIDSFFVGFAPENIAIQYNTAPVFTDYVDTVLKEMHVITFAQIGVDPDGDAIEFKDIVENANGVSLTIQNDSIFVNPVVEGLSLVTFSLSFCDVKQNSFCDTVNFYLGKDLEVGLKNDVQLVSSLYPNPAQQFLKVKLINNRNNDISLLDMTGRKLDVAILRINSSEYRIDVSDLNSGSYLVCVNNESNKSGIYFIKE